MDLSEKNISRHEGFPRAQRFLRMMREATVHGVQWEAMESALEDLESNGRSSVELAVHHARREWDF